ncbi:MAG: hypothetical protein H6590_04555 [Flavobacteriales bacterium]|nr:hypothetical protein [Flavobacteriales bacterium]
MRPSIGKTRSLVLVLGVWCGASTALAQPGFLRTYDLPAGSTVHGADATPDGGVILCGTMADSALPDARGCRRTAALVADLHRQGRAIPGSYWTPTNAGFQDVTAVNARPVWWLAQGTFGPG